MADKIQALTEFKSNIDHISDPDFGDFKRKCGNYIARLAPYFYDNDEAFQVLQDLKQFVVFDDNNREPDQVRFYIDQKIQQLQKYV